MVGVAVSAALGPLAVKCAGRVSSHGAVGTRTERRRPEREPPTPGAPAALTPATTEAPSLRRLTTCALRKRQSVPRTSLVRIRIKQTHPRGFSAPCFFGFGAVGLQPCGRGWQCSPTQHRGPCGQTSGLAPLGTRCGRVRLLALTGKGVPAGDTHHPAGEDHQPQRAGLAHLLADGLSPALPTWQRQPSDLPAGRLGQGMSLAFIPISPIISRAAASSTLSGPRSCTTTAPPLPSVQGVPPLRWRPGRTEPQPASVTLPPGPRLQAWLCDSPWSPWAGKTCFFVFQALK